MDVNPNERTPFTYLWDRDEFEEFFDWDKYDREAGEETEAGTGAEGGSSGREITWVPNGEVDGGGKAEVEGGSGGEITWVPNGERAGTDKAARNFDV